MDKWVTAKLGRYPDEFEKLNSDTWAQYKNIRIVNNENGRQYEAECRIISNEEYLRITSNSSGSEERETVIMEALADIYSQLEELKGAING